VSVEKQKNEGVCAMAINGCFRSKGYFWLLASIYSIGEFSMWEFMIHDHDI